MCCGQETRRLDNEQARWLYNRHLAGDSKRMLCAQFRIGNPEWERALAVGKALGPWSPLPLMEAL
jgi:hypothetical protein